MLLSSPPHVPHAPHILTSSIWSPIRYREQRRTWSSSYCCVRHSQSQPLPRPPSQHPVLEQPPSTSFQDVTLAVTISDVIFSCAFRLHLRWTDWQYSRSAAGAQRVLSHVRHAIPSVPRLELLRAKPNNIFCSASIQRIPASTLSVCLSCLLCLDVRFIFSYGLFNDAGTVPRLRQSPASHPGGSGSKSGQSVWDLWWTHWHWDRFFSDYFGFTLSGLWVRATPFPQRPDCLWGPPSLLFAGYWVSFPEIKRLGRESDAQLHPVPRLRMSGATPLLPLHAFKECRGFYLAVSLRQFRHLSGLPLQLAATLHNAHKM